MITCLMLLFMQKLPCKYQVLQFSGEKLFVPLDLSNDRGGEGKQRINVKNFQIDFAKY